MNGHHWSWIGASATGTSHLASGKGCEDSAACIELCDADTSVLIAVVSDGAGSARFAKLGSSIVVRCFIKAAIRYFREGGSVGRLEPQVISPWIDEIRDRIFSQSRIHSTVPREFASTLVAAIVNGQHAAVCHIGDGSCAFRSDEQSAWQVPSWPEHGEYASSTYFVTDDPAPRMRLTVVNGRFDQVVAFSDGMERLALDFSNHVASDRFFTPLANKVADDVPGRQRLLSASLRTFLDSTPVTSRTDDDKTLIVARRLRKL
jgi:hypothetical protein